MGTSIHMKRKVRPMLITPLIATVLLLYAAFSGGIHARGGSFGGSPMAASGSGTSSAASRSLHLAIEDDLLAAMEGQIPTEFQIVPMSELNPTAISQPNAISRSTESS